MLSKTIVGLSLLAFVAAQDGGTSSNSTIDPTSVDASLRSQWCSGQIATCGTLCSGSSDANTCDPDTLNYTCTCSSNGSTPGLQYYTQTLPTFICEEIYQECIVKGENDAAAQKVCNEHEKANCGHLDPDNFTAPAATSSSASSSASATGAAATGSGTGSASASAASATSTTGAASALNVGREYGTGLLAAGVAALFGFML